MAAPNKPVELLVFTPIYARGEHIVGENATTGYHRQFVASDTFVGIALRTALNVATANPLSAGGEIGNGAAGNISVPCATEGYFFWALAGGITGLVGAVTEQGTTIYCSDGQTLTTSAGGNAKVGVVVRFSVALQGWVIRFKSGLLQAASI